jgi:hypothetical protein
MLSLGSFGDVWMCVQRETGAHRAVKVIKKSYIEAKGRAEEGKDSDDELDADG